MAGSNYKARAYYSLAIRTVNAIMENVLLNGKAKTIHQVFDFQIPGIGRVHSKVTKHSIRVMLNCKDEPTEEDFDQAVLKTKAHKRHTCLVPKSQQCDAYLQLQLYQDSKGKWHAIHDMATFQCNVKMQSALALMDKVKPSGYSMV